uniref:SCP domain-containing protein n=1 Tax=Trichobilharzia regenti TaxID=157069 RepID=A0AA85JN37_TRIRE|nr:unnamed protein product [Trichobilharzia regenti]
MIDERFNEQALREHNRLRSLHGCPELQLDNELMYSAQKWAETLAEAEKLYHSNHNAYGENLAFKMSAAPCIITGDEVSQTWYSEIEYHDFSQCYHSNTRHFTQMIWKSTTHCGFGVALSADKTKAYVVGRYLPVGNKGDFTWNVPPYQGIRRGVGDNESKEETIQPTIVPKTTEEGENGSLKSQNDISDNTRESMYSLDRYSGRSSHRQSFRESLGLSERCKCYWDHTPYAPDGNSVVNEEIRSRAGSMRSIDFPRSRPPSFANNDDIHYKPVYTKSTEDLNPRTITVPATNGGGLGGGIGTGRGTPDDLHASICSPTVINLNFMNPNECIANGDFAGQNRVSIRTSLRRPPRSSSPVCNGYNFEKDIVMGKDISRGMNSEISDRGSCYTCDRGSVMRSPSALGRGPQYCSYCKQRGHNIVIERDYRNREE